MLDMLYRATKYMNAEDAMLAREEKPKKRKIGGIMTRQGAKNSKDRR